MAAAPTSPKFSDLLSDPTQWDVPDPTYADLLTVVGGGATSNSAVTARAVVNLATRSPVAIAFVIEGDEDCVHVGHTPTMFPEDITNTTPFDNQVSVLVGDKVDSAVPVVLPDDAFQRPAAFRSFDVATIIGATGHGAAPAVYRSGPQPRSESVEP